jgi:hypothetical protein
MKRALIAAALVAVAMPAGAAGPGGIRIEPSVKTSQALPCSVYGSVRGQSILAIKNTTGRTIPKHVFIEVTYVFRSGVQPMIHHKRMTVGEMGGQIRPPGDNDFSWKAGYSGLYKTQTVARSCSARVFMSPYTR